MNLEQAKELIKDYVPGHSDFITKADTADRYYRKKNDILFPAEKEKKEAENPMRNSDNRVPSNFYRLQVNQKAAYAFTKPPKFDVGSDELNELIQKRLGDAFKKKCKALCVQAANASVGWIHYWKDENGDFKYAVIDSRQIIPVWSKDLEKELYALLRTYAQIDRADGKRYIVYEIWTDMECNSFRKEEEQEIDSLQFYCMYPVLNSSSGETEYSSLYRHEWGEVPFIFFNNNDEMVSDLSDIKELIDSYDKIYSGFVNDLEDIQELIFVLTNYGGEAENAAAVLEEMKTKKVITVESEGADDRSGVSTLAIDIPVEAREKALTMTRKAIFEQGMAIDPDPQNFGNSSGVALRYLYSLLELKTGMMQTEFEVSFNHLIRALLRCYGKTAEKIIQTWTRTAVSNDTELATIASTSKGIISDETIVKNHPWVKDPDEELKLLKKQRESEGPDWDTVPTKVTSGEGGEGDGKNE